VELIVVRALSPPSCASFFVSLLEHDLSLSFGFRVGVAELLNDFSPLLTILSQDSESPLARRLQRFSDLQAAADADPKIPDWRTALGTVPFFSFEVLQRLSPQRRSKEDSL
jgi:hypothetical protein